MQVSPGWEYMQYYPLSYYVLLGYLGVVTDILGMLGVLVPRKDAWKLSRKEERAENIGDTQCIKISRPPLTALSQVSTNHFLQIKDFHPSLYKAGKTWGKGNILY